MINNMKIISCFLLVLGLSLLITNISRAHNIENPDSDSQIEKSSDHERDTLLSAARQYIDNVKYCSLITIDSAGYAHARTMDPFRPDENWVVWFGTNPNSRKVSEIKNNSNVTIYYTDNSGVGYVTIIGTAVLVDDQSLKDSLWKAEWTDFYKDRKENYLLIKVIPKRLEVLDYRHGILGDRKTWRAPAVTF
jgi:general stress protein 26